LVYSVQSDSLTHAVSSLMCIGSCWIGDEIVGAWVWPSPGNAEGKNEWNYTSTFYILLTVHHVIILCKWPTWRTNFFLCSYF